MPPLGQNTAVDAPYGRNLRRGILALVGLGTVGMSTELFLIRHYETPNQVIPLVLAGCGLIAVLWTGFMPSVLALRVLQFVMLLYTGAGVVGITLHAEANAATVRESSSTLEGLALVWKVLETTAPPALSPGLLIQLGLLGLLFTYRHPVLAETAAA